MLDRMRRNWWLTAAGVALACVYLFPLYWMAVSGLKSNVEIFRRPPTLWPQALVLDSFRLIFGRDRVGLYLLNSTLIAGGTALLTLALGTFAAYALAQVRSRWMDAALLGLLVVQVLPPALLAAPMFITFRSLGLTNNQFSVVLADMTRTVPFAIIILRTAFLAMPPEMEEAARVDGCTRVGAFWRVVLPPALPAVIVAGVIAFMMAWGDLIYSLTFLQRKELQPATVGLYSYVGSEYADWNTVMAFATVMTVPVLAAFLLLQRRIVAGLTAGAVK